MKGLFVATMLTILLVASNALCMVSTLVVFFHPKAGSSNRIVGLIIVILYVTTTSTAWLIILSCSYKYISDVVGKVFEYKVS